MTNFWTNPIVRAVIGGIILVIVFSLHIFPQLGNISVAMVLIGIESYLSKKTGIAIGQAAAKQ